VGARLLAGGRKIKSGDFVRGGEGSSKSDEFQELDHSFLALAYRGVPRIEFFQEVCNNIMTNSQCELIELWFKEKQTYYRCVHSDALRGDFKYQVVRSIEDDQGNRIPVERENSILERLRHNIIRGIHDERLNNYYIGNSLYVNDIDLFLSSRFAAGWSDDRSELGESEEIGSVAVIPIKFCEEIIGVLQLYYRQKSGIKVDKVRMYEKLAGTLGIALMTQRAQSALRERVKELTCLYSIAQVAERDRISLEGILKGITELLPPAWQFPEIAAARIILDGKIYSTPGFQHDAQKQTSRIIVEGMPRGFVEVVYTEPKADLDEGPFLSEERSLIDAIAREIAMVVERKEAEQERIKLQEQLRHADRLATLGQLAAGVAHELNEPLGSMLGFAQLAKKDPELSEQVLEDISKIEAASLHAREVVKKLMLFGRQMPPQKTQLDVNKMIEDGLYFIKSRCKKGGIEIKLSLAPDLPVITADQSQIYQVLVNLVVNAVQAMPDGGILTIATRSNADNISLIIEDTGIGMNKEVIKKIFLPFFTTKEISEGTGIGLSVVHGIIASHNGIINVDSETGKGARFEVMLPIKIRIEDSEGIDNGNEKS
jgi:signal transduction histidine kinase